MERESITTYSIRIFLLLAILTMQLLTGCSREYDSPNESILYQRYASRTGLSVAQVCGFSLNDSVRVDVVLLQAENSEVWQQLKEEFGIIDDEGTTSWLASADTPTQKSHWTNQTMTRVIASHSHHTIGLYILENEAQYDALLDYQLDHVR